LEILEPQEFLRGMRARFPWKTVMLSIDTFFELLKSWFPVVRFSESTLRREMWFLVFPWQLSEIRMPIASLHFLADLKGFSLAKTRNHNTVVLTLNYGDLAKGEAGSWKPPIACHISRRLHSEEQPCSIHVSDIKCSVRISVSESMTPLRINSGVRSQIDLEFDRRNPSMGFGGGATLATQYRVCIAWQKLRRFSRTDRSIVGASMTWSFPQYTGSLYSSDTCLIIKDDDTYDLSVKPVKNWRNLSAMRMEKVEFDRCNDVWERQVIGTNSLPPVCGRFSNAMSCHHPRKHGAALARAAIDRTSGVAPISSRLPVVVWEVVAAGPRNSFRSLFSPYSCEHCIWW
jgi:hypothetical protein